MKKRILLAATVLLLAVGLFLCFGPRSHKQEGQALAAEKAASQNAEPTVDMPSPASSGASAIEKTGHVPGLLMTIVARPENAAEIEQKLYAPSREIRYVKLNRALLDGKQSPLWMPAGKGKLDIPLPDGSVVHATIQNSTMLDQSRFSVEGSVDGQPASRVLIAGNESGQYSAAILDLSVGTGATRHLANFAIRATGTELAQYYEVDQSLIPPCGGAIKPKITEEIRQRIAARQAASALTAASTDSTKSVDSPAVAAADGTTTPTIDLMMLYTPSVAKKAGNTDAVSAPVMQSTFDLIVAQVNSDMARSGINAKVRLVKVAKVEYYESTDVLTNALSALSGMSDGTIDSIHALRDEVGADLVCMAVSQSSAASTIGLGYMMESPSIVNTSDSVGNDFFGFTTVDYNYINSTHVVSHELGHNFGCQHDRENAKDSSGLVQQGAFSYSYGYRFNGTDGNQYRTIMAYAPGTRVSYYSNPNIIASETGIGVAVGIAAGQTGESYNAQTIQKTAFEVSTFRLQKTTSFYNGRLKGLATRAFVGSGEQQLIGGIVINGSAAKRVLLRASGPGLEGVNNYLADPKITLYKVDSTGATLVDTNSSWKLHSSSALLSAGGFAPKYDSEAAMLVTLQPGNYTANIESDNGGTGIGLIEAYEVTDDGNIRLFGIATRGYADNKDGKEMIAGIAINGNGDETKRVLIRVSGPTLARDSGIQNALDDPYLELHSGYDGSLLFANDDWATGATSVNGVKDDFQPTTSLAVNGNTYTIYSGAEISNTGLAPKNRRESALLVDLKPGAYTVIIHPFTSSTQPGTAGVGLVEVYELPSSGKFY
jgi:hypothetical protein